MARKEILEQRQREFEAALDAVLGHLQSGEVEFIALAKEANQKLLAYVNALNEAAETVHSEVGEHYREMSGNAVVGMGFFVTALSEYRQRHNLSG